MRIKKKSNSVRLSKKETEDWLLETYPDADGTQEALRMAVSDARLLREGFDVTLTRGRNSIPQDH